MLGVHGGWVASSMCCESAVLVWGSGRKRCPKTIPNIGITFCVIKQVYVNCLEDLVCINERSCVFVCVNLCFFFQGRLSEEDIERMVREAEEYAEEDKAVKDRIDARNSLESYLYNMKNLLDDEEKGVAGKISEADKEVRAISISPLFCSHRREHCFKLVF